MLKALRIFMYTTIALMALGIAVSATGIMMVQNSNAETLALHQSLQQADTDSDFTLTSR